MKKKKYNTKNFQYRFDEQEGVFVREGDISVNWLLSEVLEQEKLQITKISSEEIQRFLYLLDTSDLRMLDGKHSLVWLKEQLEEKYKMSNAKQGESWAKIAERYQYIIEQIDLTLIKSNNIEEKMKIKKEEKEKPYRTQNNMKASFELL